MTSLDNARVRQLVSGGLAYGPAPESPAPGNEFLDRHGRRFSHYVGGLWRPPVSGQYLTTVNPATGETLAEFAHGNAEDVDAAVQAAQAAFPSWSQLPGFVRGQFLYAIGRAILKHERDFSVLEVMDNGKTFREAKNADVPLTARHFLYHAGFAARLGHEFPNHRPGGVIAQIIPWNFPLLMLAWKIAPAIAAGNTVVIKPAEFTPLTALLLAEILMEEVQLPPGVVNILTGDGETGAALVNHPTPWKVAFTGSTEVGRKIRTATAGSGKRLTMELGGKSAFIVCDDADIDSAVEGVVRAIWFNKGEVCCAGSRALVAEGIHDKFVVKLKARVARLRGGDPLDKCMDIGAVNSRDQLEKITRMVQQGRDEGGTVWQPDGWTCSAKGFYFPPTVVTDVEPASTLAQEEVFGPVLVVMTFRTPSEAIELANNSRYGLAASVWSENVNTVLDIARGLHVGVVWVNDTNLFDSASGFGGVRESGFGREGGREGMLDVLVETFPDEPVADPAASADAAAEVEVARVSGGAIELAPGVLLPAVDRTFRLMTGKLARPDGGRSFQVCSPSGQLLGVVSDAKPKDVRNAVEAARAAASSWGFSTSADNRDRVLKFLMENLAAERERFVEVIRASRGCSRKQAEREFALTIERLFFFASAADKFLGTVQPVAGRLLVAATKEPVGVIGIRAPDEHPLLGFVTALAPALSMGNAVVIVAGRQPLPALELIQLLQHSDVPGGVVNVLTAKDPGAIARALGDHEDVDSVWCFGDQSEGAAVEVGSAFNMKRTWCPYGEPVNWTGAWGRSDRFLEEATRTKNTWVRFGA